MTPEQLRELDAWIAEKVMGWKRIKSRSSKNRIAWKNGADYWFTGEERSAEMYECDHPENEMFRPTTNPAASMQVLERCNDKLAFGITIQRTPSGWAVCMNVGGKHNTEAPTLPLAICKFAQKLFSK